MASHVQRTIALNLTRFERRRVKGHDGTDMITVVGDKANASPAIGKDGPQTDNLAEVFA